jgi:hypothetical protein
MKQGNPVLDHEIVSGLFTYVMKTSRAFGFTQSCTVCRVGVVKRFSSNTIRTKDE